MMQRDGIYSPLLHCDPRPLRLTEKRGEENDARITTPGGRTGRRSELNQIDALLYLIENGPGRSDLELAEAIYGDGTSQLRVQQDLARLVSSGEIGAGALAA